MKKLRLLPLLTLIMLLVGHILTPVAAAHPLGNFTINQYAGLHVSRNAITLDYVLDMAEIPTFQEMATIDANRNGQADAEESARYHPAQCTAIQADLDLRLDHHPLTLTLESSALEFPPGAGGLLTLRLTCVFQVNSAPTNERVQLEFKNRAYADRLGWREIVVTGESVTLEGDLAAMSQSTSQRLSTYPNDLLSSPLDQRVVTFHFTPLAEPGQPAAQRTSELSNLPSRPQFNLSTDRNDGFTRLITVEELSPLTLLIALAISFSWGAAHALTPGHGKSIVAAYLIGSHGTTRHAFFLGLTTTVTHTAGVFALGLLTLFASQFILPEQLYPWLGVASGALVVTMGVSLFRERLSWLRGSPDHSHDHDHLHPHDHSHDHGHTHRHLPPRTAGSPITWRGLLALGVSGGLIPCPSALVVMLSAIALQRIGFGLLLIVVFSLGLASVLTLIGMLWVHAGRLFERIPASGHLFRVLPIGSALFIILIGLGIVWQALLQTGVLPTEVVTLAMKMVEG